jgi:hypothetical protein
MSRGQRKPGALEQAHEGMQGEPGNLIVFDLRRLTHFRDERPYAQVL